jgi:hypothetical protein
MHTGVAIVQDSDGRTMPAVVTAKASTQPRVGTLRLTPQPDGGVAALLIRGSGQTLDVQTTLSSTERRLTSAQRKLAVLAGNLASQSGYDGSSTMKQLGVDFVLLAPPATSLDARTAQPEAKATGDRASTALDGNPLLAPVGVTGSGRLWAFDRGTAAEPAAALVPADAGGMWRTIVLLVQGLVIGIALLMSIPTARSADRVSELNARRPTGRHGADAEAVMPDDEPERHDGDPAPADETLSEYEAEPGDEASVEAAEDELPAEAEGTSEPEQEQEPEREPEAEPDQEPEAEPDPAPHRSSTDDMAFAGSYQHGETTLEEGLDETVIRPRREWEGADRG